MFRIQLIDQRKTHKNVAASMYLCKTNTKEAALQFYIYNEKFTCRLCRKKSSKYAQLTLMLVVHDDFFKSEKKPHDKPQDTV